MAVTVYRSTDTSAPTLSGTVGDLVNVLDKCLVAGYGSQTAAGWTKPYTGTNAAVFRMGGGNQFYLDVNDNGPGGATAQEARVRGYETMTAVATGTGPFPTVALAPNGLFVRKSAAASGTTRVWTVIADDRTFYLFIQAADTAGRWYGFTFGDFYSYVSGTDNFRTLIIGRATEASSTTTIENLDLQAALNGVVLGHYVARSYTGLGGSIAINKQGDISKGTPIASLNGAIAVPNPVDGNIWLAPVTICQQSLAFRGKTRGFHHFLHTIASFADQDTVTGAGVYAGRTFLLFKATGSGGAFCIDITGPWDTN